MKNRRLIFGLAMVVLTAIVLGCGASDDPKALARETVELTAEMIANPSKKPELEKRMKEIEAKVEKMSVTKQLVYSTELLRVSAEKTGEIYKDAFSGSEAESALKELGEALSSPEAQQGLKELGEAFSSPEAQQGLNEIKEASEELQDALKGLGALGQ